MRNALRSALFGILAFVTVGVPTYVVLWNRAGLNFVTKDDGPAVVLGAIWCMGWAVVIGTVAAACTFAITFAITHKKRSKMSIAAR